MEEFLALFATRHNRWWSLSNISRVLCIDHAPLGATKKQRPRQQHPLYLSERHSADDCYCARSRPGPVWPLKVVGKGGRGDVRWVVEWCGVVWDRPVRQTEARRGRTFAERWTCGSKTADSARCGRCCRRRGGCGCARSCGSRSCETRQQQEKTR